MNSQIRKFVVILVITTCVMFSNTQYAQANTIKVNGKTVTKTIEGFDNVYYDFNLSKQTKVTITLETSIANNNSGEVSFSVYKSYNKDTDEGRESGIKTIWDKTINGEETIEKTLVLSKGEYSISMWNYNSSNVKYKLSIKNVSTPPTKIDISKTLQVKVGTPQYIKVNVIEPEDAINTGITWSTSNSKIATVSSNGQVHAKAEGTCNIIAELQNGKKYKCKITVPKPSLEQQLKIKSSYAKFLSVSDEYIYNDCEIRIYNNTNKDISYVELYILQYDNRGYSLKSPYSIFVYEDTIEAKTNVFATYWVNESTKKARACIKKVWYSDGTTWTNPLYNTWSKKYKNKNY